MAKNVALCVVLFLSCMFGAGCGDIDSELPHTETDFEQEEGEQEEDLAQCVEGFIEEPLASMMIMKTGTSSAIRSPDGFEGVRIEVILKKIYIRNNDMCSNINTGMGDDLAVSLHRVGTMRESEIEKFHFKNLELNTEAGFRVLFSPFEERGGDFFFIRVSSTACFEVEINKIVPACLVRK